MLKYVFKGAATTPPDDALFSVLSKIPVARRTAIFDREIRSSDHDATTIIAEHYLDLAPESVATILAMAEARGELRDTLSWGYLKRWRRKVPRIDAILKQYTARAKKEPKPPPPPPKPAGTLSFHDPMAVYPNDYPKLDAIAKAQYRGAAEGYLGGKVRDAKHFVRRLEKDEMNEGDAEMRRWKVLQGKKHVYDFWIVWVDNGSLFFAGTSKRVPVHQIQSDFQALDKKPASKALAEDFNNSAPSDLWTVSKAKKR